MSSSNRSSKMMYLFVCCLCWVCWLALDCNDMCEDSKGQKFKGKHLGCRWGLTCSFIEYWLHCIGYCCCCRCVYKGCWLFSRLLWSAHMCNYHSLWPSAWQCNMAEAVASVALDYIPLTVKDPTVFSAHCHAADHSRQWYLPPPALSH